MNPKKLELLRKSTQQLSRASATNHRLVLDRLCRTHQHQWPEFSSLLSLISRGNWFEALELTDSWSKQQYTDPAQHFAVNQMNLLLKKYPYEQGRASKMKLDPEGTALKKFWHSEHYCKRVNQRFRAFRNRSPSESSLSAARSFIRYVIGDSPDLGRIFGEGWWGPGANLGVHGNATNFGRKLLAHRWSVTPGAWQYGRYAFLNNAQIFEVLCPEGPRGVKVWDADQARESYDRRVTILQHNKITFVPKTAKTYRSIAVEPLVNGYLQKGVDLYLRSRLKRVRIDLQDQRPNQLRALWGSEDDSEEGFVTIDLSAASDSLATEVVRNLLPAEWFEFLNALRSPYGKFRGKVFRYEKFCSMGNGFCFPLETLIFAALCRASGAQPYHDFVVYGDDIAIRKRYAETLIRLLGVCGFRINVEKTFLKGPFRESCGEDWFEGETVRPVTLDYALDSVQSIFVFSNMTLQNERTKLFFEDVRPFLFGLVPREFRFFRPEPGPEDGAFTVDHDFFISTPCALWSRQLQRWRWYELKTQSFRDKGLEQRQGYETALVTAALLGSRSARPFTLRRKSRTKVVVVPRSGGR